MPSRFHDPIARAALRWNVPMNVLAAQLYAESGFNPFARSPAGAEGIAQFMPGTADAYGLRDPFDPVAAIDAQAHLMSDLLEQFGGKVALALAGYNAGAGRGPAVRRRPAVRRDAGLRGQDPRAARRRGRDPGGGGLRGAPGRVMGDAAQRKSSACATAQSWKVCGGRPVTSSTVLSTCDSSSVPAT